ncbi:MAG: type II secretion system protein [Chloroflexi bacterium]|nr:type II secretion system protein [Chloroflexota bacterium]
MFAKNTKNQAGFTIVEVMIVLAIAGLVLAIVFIAVPALQRNSRNTQRRSDLANLRAQFDTWTANNGTKIPRDTVLSDLSSIVGSTGWGHYNGNVAAPTRVFLNTTTTPAHCSDPAHTTQAACTGAGETWNPAVTTTPQLDEHRIGYATDLSAADLANLEYPGRQEIHVFGEMECVLSVLTGGNDIDARTGTPAKYAAAYADLKNSHAKALAYVYQIEGEDNARCEDNT